MTILGSRCFSFHLQKGLQKRIITYESQANHRDAMWETGLLPVFLNTTLENTSTPKEIRTFISVQVFWMQATDTDFDLFQKRRTMGSSWKISECCKSRLSDCLVMSNTKIALQMHLERLTLELLSLSPGHELKLCIQMTPDTGHCCWHCWSTALRTWSYRNGFHYQRSSVWILASIHVWFPSQRSE